MKHLTTQQLSASIDGALSGLSLELVRQHLAECAECRTREARLARLDGLVGQLVSHDPGDAWLDALCVEIDERVTLELDDRFDPPAHPAGPPPLEHAGSAALSPEELQAIWEEGSTTPRPVVAKNEGAPMAPPPAEPVAGKEPVRASTAPPPAHKEAAPASAAPREPARASDAPPGPRAPAGSPPTSAIPAAARATAPKPTLGGDAARTPAQASPPAARPPAPHPHDVTPRWGAHAERIVRARREAASPSRETLVPLASGLIGGAVAGALIVTMFFVQRGATPASSRAAAATAASPAPVVPADVDASRPVVERAPVLQTQSPRETSPPVMLPHATPEPSFGSEKPASRTRSGSRTASRSSMSARAVPTGDDAWPLLCGEVVDEAGAPITGARILLADLDLGVRTDRRGRFCLSAPPGDRTLSIVALGFVTHRTTVTIGAGAADRRFVLATP